MNSIGAILYYYYYYYTNTSKIGPLNERECRSPYVVGLCHARVWPTRPEYMVSESEDWRRTIKKEIVLKVEQPLIICLPSLTLCYGIIMNLHVHAHILIWLCNNLNPNLKWGKIKHTKLCRERGSAVPPPAPTRSKTEWFVPFHTIPFSFHFIFIFISFHFP